MKTVRSFVSVIILPNALHIYSGVLHIRLLLILEYVGMLCIFLIQYPKRFWETCPLFLHLHSSSYPTSPFKTNNPTTHFYTKRLSFRFIGPNFGEEAGLLKLGNGSIIPNPFGNRSTLDCSSSESLCPELVPSFTNMPETRGRSAWPFLMVSIRWFAGILMVESTPFSDTSRGLLMSKPAFRPNRLGRGDNVTPEEST